MYFNIQFDMFSHNNQKHAGAALTIDFKQFFFCTLVDLLTWQIGMSGVAVLLCLCNHACQAQKKNMFKYFKQISCKLVKIFVEKSLWLTKKIHRKYWNMAVEQKKKARKKLLWRFFLIGLRTLYFKSVEKD